MEQNNQQNHDRFIELLRSTKRDGIEYVIEDLEDYGFFDAPASCQGHGSFAGGLLEHSLNVYDSAIDIRANMIKQRPDLEASMPIDSIIIASLLHDVCKMDLYQLARRKRRNEIGVYEEYEQYEVHEERFPIGHGEKSVIILLRSGLEMTDDEMTAIRWHMGPWNLSRDDEKFYRHSHKRSPLPAIIHTADTLASAILERPAPKI